MIRSKALEAKRELNRIYMEIARIKAKLQGEKRVEADEIEGQIYLGKLTPQEALERIKQLTRS